MTTKKPTTFIESVLRRYPHICIEGALDDTVEVSAEFGLYLLEEIERLNRSYVDLEKLHQVDKEKLQETQRDLHIARTLHGVAVKEKERLAAKVLCLEMKLEELKGEQNKNDDRETFNGV